MSRSPQLLTAMQQRTALRVGLQRVIVPPAASPRGTPKPPAALPPLVQVRTLLTRGSRRSTSFWAPSFPPASPAAPNIPGPSSLPPLPAPSAVTQEDAKSVDGRRRLRKQRYLDSLMDKAGEMGLKCSVLDAHGNWTAEEGTYRTLDLCRAHDLDPRDLRKLDSLTPSLVPIILTRRSCILISILHIRALIKPDRVIIFNAPGTEDGEAAKRFKAHLQANVRAGLTHAATSTDRESNEEDLALNYEHRALESILVDTANALEEEMAFVRRLVQELLDSFEHDINRDNLRKLLHYSRRLAGFQSRAKYIKSAFDELLDSDEDLSAMYLTDKLQGKPRALHDHEQLELLLESFTKQAEEIVSEIDTMVANVQSTQEVAELMLDSGRNALLALDIKVSMATLGVGAGAMMAGLFGMNLTSGLEQTPYAFIAVTGTTAAAALLVYWYSSRVLRKVRHVALVGRPNSLPESVREAKERFVRERAERERALEAAYNAETACGSSVPATSANLKPIPDYESRWVEVRSSLKSRQSLWDRIFRPHSFRRTLLGMRSARAATPQTVRVTIERRNPIPPSSTTSHTPSPSPTQAPRRPTAPRHDVPSLSRSQSSGNGQSGKEASKSTGSSSGASSDV